MADRSETTPFGPNERRAFMQKVTELAADYCPNPTVENFSRRLGITAIAGPTGSGKSTLLELSGIPVVLGVTSRAPRLEDGERDGVGFRRFLNLSQKNTRYEIIKKLEEGAYVQAASPRAIGNFYGSEPVDYPVRNMAINTSTRELFHLAGENPYGRLTGIFVVPESFDEWQRRWLGRTPELPADYQPRMQEAREALELATGNNGLYFVLNKRDEPEPAAKLLRDISNGYEMSMTDQMPARIAAHYILQELIARA